MKNQGMFETYAPRNYNVIMRIAKSEVVNQRKLLLINTI